MKKKAVVKKVVETKKIAPARKITNIIEQNLSRLGKIRESKPAEKDFLATFFNKQRDRGFTTHVHRSSDSAATDVFEILCLAMGIIGIVISWIPFVGFVTPAVSFISAYKTKKKNSRFMLAGVVLSVVSVVICASVMITLGVKPSVFGI